MLDGVGVGIDEGGRVGVIGRNGSGRSTLLRVLAGVQHALDVVVDADSEPDRIFRRHRERPDDPDLTALMDTRGLWDLEHVARGVLDRFDVAADRAVGRLSGGKRMRVALAPGLVHADVAAHTGDAVPLLILDEPTNHLDVDAIEWLEDRIRQQRGHRAGSYADHLANRAERAQQAAARARRPGRLRTSSTGSSAARPRARASRGHASSVRRRCWRRRRPTARRRSRSPDAARPAELSGAERRRLELVRVLATVPNLLLLDEPTNDLDIDTPAVLEGYPETWPGTLVAASHDRFFLDRVCGQLWSIEPDGTVREHPGGWTAYRAHRPPADVGTGGRRGRSDGPTRRSGRVRPGQAVLPRATRAACARAEAARAGAAARHVARSAGRGRDDHIRAGELAKDRDDVMAEIDRAETRWLELQLPDRLDEPRGRQTVSMNQPLVWIDLEMTGLDPDVDVIVEIATIVTDGSLEQVEHGPDLVVAAPGAALDGMADVVKRMHTASGLLDEIRATDRTVADAEQATLHFIRGHVPSPSLAPLAGNSVHADRAFLRRYMPTLEAYLHYRNVDVSTLKELARRWRPALLEQAPDKHERHRALDDIVESIAELRFYRDALFGTLSDNGPGGA